MQGSGWLGLAARGDLPVRVSVTLAGLEIDLAAHTVRRDREEIHLTPTEFDLLRVLLRNRGRLLPPPRAVDRGVGRGVRR